MKQLNDVMKDYVKVQLAYIATVDEEGNPNIGPKRTCRLLNDSQLIFNENTGGQTIANINSNGKIALAFVDREAVKGFRFVGKARAYTEGVYIDLAKEKIGTKPKYAAVVIDVERIYTLDSGPKAGKEVE